MTPQQREAALRLIADGSSGNLEWSRQVIALLRELAAEPDHMDELRKACAELLGNDPATWPDHGNAPLAIAASVAILCKAAEPAQEPVAWIHPLDMNRFGTVTFTRESDEQIPLYAHPPQRKPLTREQIKRCVDEAHGRGLNVVDQLSDLAIKVARAIERAHGITE